jgi:hypothetical protein
MGDIKQIEITLQLGLSKCKSKVIFVVYFFKYSNIEIVRDMYNRQIKCTQILRAQFLGKYPLWRRWGDYKPNHNIKKDIKETSEDVM